MTGLWLTLAVVLLMAVVGAWFSWTATRLDQLHHRIDLGRESLNTQLALRSGVVLELVGSGVLDAPEAVLLSDKIVMMTNGPSATIGEVLSINLERPRNRVQLAEDRQYVHYRKAVIDFLYTRQGHVEKAA